jgi:hypothetical protein
MMSEAHERTWKLSRYGVNRPSRLQAICLTIVLGTVILVLLIPLPHAWRSTWRSKLLDLGHIPLFAFLTFAIYRNLRVGLAVAFCIAASTAAACELAQAAVMRAADFTDFLRGVIGSLLVVVLARGFRSPLKTGTALAHLAVAALLLVWPVVDAIPKLWDAVDAYRSFPIICDFQTRWQSHRWYKERATVERITGIDWRGPSVGQMEFYPNGATFGAVILFPVIHDWSRYHQLCCDLVVPDEAVDLLISVRDGRRVTGNRKRFDMLRQYLPGDHHVRIDLDSLARGDEFAPLDLTHIESFHLVVQELEQPKSLIVQKVWLE